MCKNYKLAKIRRCDSWVREDIKYYFADFVLT